MTLSLRHLLLPALLVTGCSIPITVNGQTRMMRLGGGSAHDKLNDLNERINATRKLLVERVGANPAVERANIDKARQELAAERAALTGDLKSDQAAYQSVSSNLSDAEQWNESSAAALEAELALKPAIDADAAGQEVTAAQLADLESKVNAAQARAFQGWKNVTQHQGERLGTLKANVAAGPARREEAKRRAEAKAKADAVEQQRVAAQKVGQEANQTLRRAYDALARHEVPSEALLGELEQRAAAVEAIIPTGGQFYRNEAGLLRLYANLNQAEGAELLKAQLGGAVAAKGEAHGKDFKASVKAQANHCYVFFGEIISWGGQEQIIEPDLVTPTTGPAMQEFRVGFANEAALADKWKGIVGFGACAVQAGPLTFQGGLKVAGSRNGLRWAVLDFTRGEFPTLLATHLNLELPDDCDGEAWATMFTNPVPGTIGYLAAEPVLLVSADPVGGNHDLSIVFPGPRQWTRTHKAEVSSTPPAHVAFKHPFEFRGCPERNGKVMPRAPLSRQLAECAASIEKKYEGAWASVDRARDIADRASTNTVKFYNPAAEEKAGRLREAYDRDWDLKCKPLEERARKTLEARFNKLVDSLTDAPPTDGVKRAQLNASEEDAPWRRW